jgi:hypothetical protein
MRRIHLPQQRHYQTTVALRAERVARRLGRLLTPNEYERLDRTTIGYDPLAVRRLTARYPRDFRLAIDRSGERPTLAVVVRRVA